MLKFSILQKDKKSGARAGIIKTAHGIVGTPAFVPVGTKATVKGLTPQDLKEIGVQLLFGNTYHLHLRPGEDIVEKFGGLGKFMSWDGPTITDSGGFQVFSLGRLMARGPATHSSQGARSSLSFGTERTARLENSPFASPASEESPVAVKITNNGVKFRSHIDGSLHEFTPEKSIEIQQKLGADLILAFDECAPHPSTYEYTKEAMERTHAWAVRSLAAHKSTSEESLRNTSEVTKASDLRFLRGGSRQALYGVIQGGIYKDLREQSAKFISQLPFDGIAIGGVAVGESKKEMRDVLTWVHPYLPEDKPRHLLGIGEIDDIFDAIDAGMDTFDCVIPTRFGRYGIAFISPPEGNIKNKFRLQLSKTMYAKDQRPLSKDCECSVCRDFTRAYIHHLFRSQELLAYRLVSYHNLYFVTNLVKQIRESLVDGGFDRLKREWLR